MIFYYCLKGTIFFHPKGTIHHHRPQGTIPHHRPQRDDTSSSSPKGDIYHRPQRETFIIIPRDDSSLSSLWDDISSSSQRDDFLSSPKGRFIIIVPSGTIFYHRPF